MPKLYLYPGAHKTGTSLLQRALEICRADLEAQGFAIARRAKFYKSFQAVVRTATKHLRHDLDNARIQAQEMFETDSLDKDLILSIENIFGEFGPNPYGAAERVLDNLKLIFPDHEIEATYYIRRQDTFLESYYVQCIHKGFDMDWSDFWDMYGDVEIDWATPIRQLEDKLGSANVNVRAFESIKRGLFRFIGDFFGDFAPNETSALVRKCRGKMTGTNMSLSVMGINIARAGFPFIEDRREREQFTKLLQSAYGVDKGTRFKIGDDLRAKIAKIYVEPNKALLKTLKLSPLIREQYEFSDILTD